MNSWKAGGEVNTPWLHPGATPIIRDWIRFRYRMLPYLYTLYWRAARVGEPMLRPRFIDFPDDPRAFDDTDDYHAGPNLLVASVVEPGARERAVYLPVGPADWMDFWTGARHRAGTTIVAEAPLTHIPLFVPAGGILPMTDTSDMSRRHDEPSRALRVFPGAKSGASEFVLYEDDGLSLRHLDGESAELRCSLQWTPKAVAVRVRRRGRYALPYTSVRVVLPPGERRRLSLTGHGVELRGSTAK